MKKPANSWRPWVTCKTRVVTVCLTNNPLWRGVYGIQVMDCAPGDIFVTARDLIHKGWRLAAHPLYGNFHPLRHPFRTLVLFEPNASGLDMESLEFIDGALLACREGIRDIDREGSFPRRLLEDFAMLDRALTEELVREHIGGGGRP